MRKLLVGIAVLASVLLVAPAAQAEVPSVKIDLLSAKFVKSNAVRVVGQLTCPVGYDVVRSEYPHGAGVRTVGQIDQYFPPDSRDDPNDDPVVSPLESYRLQVSCSGVPDRFVLKFFPDPDSDGRGETQFLADVPLRIDLGAVARSASGDKITDQIFPEVTLPAYGS